MRRLMLAGLVLAMVMAAPLARPARAAGDYGHDLCWGLAAIGANLVYAPVKLLYATMGGVTGGFAYVLTMGNGEVVQRIWAPSVGGTYVLSPAMLSGDESIYFSGESYD